MDDNNPKVSVCVCTFRRPQLLRKLLERLCGQVDSTPSFEVVVVDNDVGETARPVVQALRGQVPYRLRYDVEPEQNISRARNRAIANADAEWLAMIDDDEYPVPNWLEAAASAARRFAADIVMGPVFPEYSASTPAWAKKSGVFERKRFATGEPVPWDDSRTSNVLLRRSCLYGLEAPFDPAYGLTGGEDTALFRRLARAGVKMVWCDEAAVYEALPADRLQADWLFARYMRGGQSFAIQHLRNGGTAPAVVIKHLAFIARTLGAGAISATMLVLTVPLGKHHWMRWWCTLAAQLGKASYYWRWRPEPYRAGTA